MHGLLLQASPFLVAASSNAFSATVQRETAWALAKMHHLNGPEASNILTPYNICIW